MNQHKFSTKTCRFIRSDLLTSPTALIAKHVTDHNVKLDQYNRSLLACSVLHQARDYRSFEFQFGVGKDASRSYTEKFCDGVIDMYGHVLEIPPSEYLTVAEFLSRYGAGFLPLCFYVPLSLFMCCFFLSCLQTVQFAVTKTRLDCFSCLRKKK